ncbi:TylF/MycF/NovP-related O-methyltransferase [Hyphobacterium sp.]|uniref:TylF/MycF/NovP-related O-methyltransferase n=1 Tax=Hyphobacterium sp. TaxID=2004662 RepID=UPI003B516CD6
MRAWIYFWGTNVEITNKNVGDILKALNSDELRPEVEKFVSTVADVFAARSKMTRLDVKDIVDQLSSGSLNYSLQQFFTGNHRFVAFLTEMNNRTAVESHDFVENVLPDAMFARDQFRMVEAHKDEIIRTGGHILDLGVYKGSSTKALARTFPDHIIHGFDSFEGLPEDWAGSMKGAFNINGILPDMPDNVRLYKGWFDDTLPGWFEENKDRHISLLRVDCDLYSSTKTIFNVLKPLIKSGTWIIFDELIGYRGFKEHEYKAFKEYIDEANVEFEYTFFGLTYAMGYIR